MDKKRAKTQKFSLIDGFLQRIKTWTENLQFRTTGFFPEPWPIVWGIFYVAIVVMSMIAPGNSATTFVKLSGIILCFFYTFWYFPHDRLLQLAFLATSISDIFLAINNTSLIGLGCFMITQILHQIRLSDNQITLWLKVYLVVSLITILSDLWLNFLPLIYVVCGFYLIMLLKNIVSAYKWCFQKGQHTFLELRTSKNYPAIFALIGFVLFLACDICTGISYFALIGVFPWFMYSIANFFAWTFYYPSQIFISNSSKCDIIASKKVLTEVTDGR